MFWNSFSEVTAVEKADIFNEFFHSVFSTNSRGVASLFPRCPETPLSQKGEGLSQFKV